MQRHMEAKNAAEVFHRWLAKPNSQRIWLLAVVVGKGTLWSARVTDRTARACILHRSATAKMFSEAALARGASSGPESVVLDEGGALLMSANVNEINRRVRLKRHDSGEVKTCVVRVRMFMSLSTLRRITYGLRYGGSVPRGQADTMHMCQIPCCWKICGPRHVRQLLSFVIVLGMCSFSCVATLCTFLVTPHLVHASASDGVSIVSALHRSLFASKYLSIELLCLE